MSKSKAAEGLAACAADFEGGFEGGSTGGLAGGAAGGSGAGFAGLFAGSSAGGAARGAAHGACGAAGGACAASGEPDRAGWDGGGQAKGGAPQDVHSAAAALGVHSAAAALGVHSAAAAFRDRPSRLRPLASSGRRDELRVVGFAAAGRQSDGACAGRMDVASEGSEGTPASGGHSHSPCKGPFG